MNYLHYIRLLKSGGSIRDYNHSMMLTRLATVRYVSMAWVVPSDAASYTEYRYNPLPTIDFKSIVADVTPKTTSAHIRLHPRTVYLADGKRITREQWTGRAYPVVGERNGFLLLDTGFGIIGRKSADVKVA